MEDRSEELAQSLEYIEMPVPQPDGSVIMVKIY